MRDDLIRCYLGGWRHTFDYEGVSTRKEFWVFVLANLFILNIFAVVTNMMVITGISFFDIVMFLSTGFSLQVLFIIFLIIPVMSLGVRRMHDIGRNGWWFSSLLIANVFIIPALLGALVSSIANYFTWDVALPVTMLVSLILNISVISYLIYLCCKPSLQKPQQY